MMVAASVLLHVYRILTIILGPLIDLYLWRRKQIGKEDPVRFRERMGFPSAPRPDGSIIWIHAASVGETMSVLALIERMLVRYPDLFVLLTTGTVSSARMLESRLPERAMHQYIPVDRYLAVRRFLRHWRPDLALWVESEIWPNLIAETDALKCPLVLLNARMSSDSFRMWQYMRSLAYNLLIRFSLIFPQSEEDSLRYRNLGARTLMAPGNLKFDAPPLPVDPKETGALLNMAGDRPLWLAASTHPGEEAMVAKVHDALKDKYPDLLTLLAPRHPPRGDEVAELLTGNGLKIGRRSKGDAIAGETDVYLIDTVGELGLFYRLTQIVFIGGSLVDHGGHNPLEAARLNCAIICGPFMSNFAEICRELAENRGYVRVDNVESLTTAVDRLLSDHAEQEELALAAARVVERKKGVTDSILSALSIYLDPLSRIVEPEAKEEPDEEPEHART